MNIGILTFHWVSNFGAQLQTLSTYNYIKNNGHIPYIINWIPKDLEDAYNRRVSAEQNLAHRQFSSQQFTNITKQCRDGIDIAAEIDRLGIDKVIIGSDAVFSYIPAICRIYIGRKGIKYIKPLSVNDLPSPFWGDFYNLTKNKVKLIAMSASAQNTQYKKIYLQKTKDEFLRYLLNFDYISVRDVWTKEMLSYVTGGKIMPIITPDPVFGFQQNVFPQKEYYVREKLGITGKYILITLNHNYVKFDWILYLERRLEEMGITLIGLPQTDKQYSLPLKNRISFPLDPLSWYNLIRESDGYIGELMHPILVALHNSVPVFSFDRYGFRKGRKLDIKSSKTYQILKQFDLLDNYYNALWSSKYPAIEHVIDRILNFDKVKCSVHATAMLDYYSNMMNNILTI